MYLPLLRCCIKLGSVKLAPYYGRASHPLTSVTFGTQQTSCSQSQGAACLKPAYPKVRRCRACTLMECHLHLLILAPHIPYLSGSTCLEHT